MRGVRRPVQTRDVVVSVPAKDPCPKCPHHWHGFRCGVSNTNLCACPTSISDELLSAERHHLAGVNGGWTPPKAGQEWR